MTIEPMSVHPDPQPTADGAGAEADDQGLPRIMAFDLDGTLLDTTTRISPRTVKSLRSAAEAGVELVVATGRSQISVIPRVAHLGLFRWAVCSNGATLYDLHEHRVVEQVLIGSDDVVALMDGARSVLPDIAVAWETTAGHQWTESFAAIDTDILAPRDVVPDVDYPPAGLVKLFLGHHRVVHDRLFDTLAPVMPPDITLTTSGAPFMEAMGRGVNKAVTLAALCQRLGVAADQVVAFGDNLNDIEMLNWVGRGYAMANAHPEILARARFRTDLPHDRHGVAAVIERLLDC